MFEYLPLSMTTEAVQVCNDDAVFDWSGQFVEVVLTLHFVSAIVNKKLYFRPATTLILRLIKQKLTIILKEIVYLLGYWSYRQFSDVEIIASDALIWIHFGNYKT